MSASLRSSPACLRCPRPSPKQISADSLALARSLAGAAADLCNVDSATLARPDLARFYLSQVMASHQVGFSAFAATPTVARLVNLSRGHALVLELLAASLRANASEVPFSRRAFASAYGVSRTHVIDLLNECEATGIITPASAQTLTLSPTFLTEARPRAQYRHHAEYA